MANQKHRKHAPYDCLLRGLRQSLLTACEISPMERLEGLKMDDLNYR